MAKHLCPPSKGKKKLGIHIFLNYIYTEGWNQVVLSSIFYKHRFICWFLQTCPAISYYFNYFNISNNCKGWNVLFCVYINIKSRTDLCGKSDIQHTGCFVYLTMRWQHLFRNFTGKLSGQVDVSYLRKPPLSPLSTSTSGSFDYICIWWGGGLQTPGFTPTAGYTEMTTLSLSTKRERAECTCCGNKRASVFSVFQQLHSRHWISFCLPSVRTAASEPVTQGNRAN